MRYSDIYNQAKKNDNVEPISAVYKKDWKKNEEMVGKLISMEPLKSEKYDKVYYSYLFNTDEGNIKTALGAGVDTEVRPFMKVGQVYRVVFKGEIDTGKGNPMKDFRVEWLNFDGIVLEPEVDQEEIDFEE